MVLSAEANKAERLSRPLWEALLKMVGPYAPHLAEELWQKLGQTASIAYAAWPGFDPLLCESDELTIVVQFNGKLRADFQVPKDTGREEQERLARLHPKVQEYLVGKEIVKVVVVPGKLVNFVVR